MATSKVTVTLGSTGPFYEGDEITLKVRVNPSLGYWHKKDVFLSCEGFFEKEYKVNISSHEDEKVKFIRGSEDPVDIKVTSVVEVETPTLSVTVKPFPEVDFADTPITDAVAIPEAGEGIHGVGPAKIHLKLSAQAPPGGAEVRIQSDAFHRSHGYTLKFPEGATEASKIQELYDTNGSSVSIGLEGSKKCHIKSGAGASVQVDLPKISFDDPCFDPVPENDAGTGKPRLIAEKKHQVKLKLDYPAPDTVRGEIQSPALKRKKSFSISKGQEATSVEVELGSRETAQGEKTLSIANTRGCRDGVKMAADIYVAPPLTINFSPDDGWITTLREETPPLVCVGEKVTFHAVLNLEAPESKAYANLKVENADAGQFMFTEGDKEAPLEYTLVKFDTSTRVQIEPLDCEAGDNYRQNLAVHQENSVDLNDPLDETPPPYYKGDKIKIPVTLKYTAVEDATAAVIKCPELFDSTTYDVQFKKGATEPDPPLEVEITKEITQKSKVSLEVVPEAGKFRNKDTAKLDVRPFPEVRFNKHRNETRPLKEDVEKDADGNYEFRITKKPLVVLRLEDKPPMSGAKVRIVSEPEEVLGAENVFAEFTDNARSVEVALELKKAVASATIKLVETDIKGCKLHGEHLSFKVKVLDGALNLHDQWINPNPPPPPADPDKPDAPKLPFGPYAVGDQVWIRVERTAENLNEGTFGKIISPAFGKHPDNPDEDLTFDVVFRQDETISELIAYPEGMTIVDPDGSDRTPATGIRWRQHNKNKPVKMTIQGKEETTYGPGEYGEREVEVHEFRYLHFSSGAYDKVQDFYIKQVTDLKIATSIPARPGTVFNLLSPAFGAPRDYRGEFQQDSKSSRVKVDFADALFLESSEEQEKIEIMAEVGNMSLKPGSQTKRGHLDIKLKTPIVTFNKEKPFKEEVHKETKWFSQDVSGVFGLDTTATIQLELSAPAREGTTAVIRSDAFDKEYEVAFPKDAQSAECEVEFKNGSDEHPYEIRLIGDELLCMSDFKSDGSLSNKSKILVKVDPHPTIHFPYPPLPPEEESEEQHSIIDPSQRGEWIEPANLPFVKNEKAKIKVMLSRPAPEGGAKAVFKCPVFPTKDGYTVEIGQDEQEKVIEVTFAKHKTSPNQMVTLEALENCVVGTHFCSPIQVFENRKVYFPPNRVIEPRGPFIIGDEAKIGVRLKYPAPVEGAKASVSGPFEGSPKEITFVKGEMQKYGEDAILAKFNGESTSPQKIELIADSNCIIDRKSKTSHEVMIYTPIVSFNNEKKIGDDPPGAVEEPDQVMPGAEVCFWIKLDKPAPVNGCTVRVASEAFPMESGERTEYIIAVPRNDTEANLVAKIDFDYELGGQTKKVTLKEANRCKLAAAQSDIELDLEIHKGLSVGFEKGNKINNEAGAAVTGDHIFNEGDSAVLNILANSLPVESIRGVQIDSNAFGGKAYRVTLPQDSVEPVKQTVVLTRGRREVGGEVPDQKIYLRTPRGWVPDPEKDEDSQTEKEPNLHCIFVKVKAPEPADTTARCPLEEAEDYRELTDIESKLEAEEALVDSEPCNLHRMFLTVTHGDPDPGNIKGEKATERGPAKNGTFEVVMDKNLATPGKEGQALLCTPTQTPILQVCARRERWDPHLSHLDDMNKSPHHAWISVELDPKDKYCNKLFQFEDETDIKQHPIVTVNERVKGRPSKIERFASKVADKVHMVEEKVTNAFQPITDKKAQIDQALAAKMDQVKSIFEPVRRVRRAALTKIAESTGLEWEAGILEEEVAEEEEQEQEQEYRSWISRYEWKPVKTTISTNHQPESEREGVDSEAGEAETVLAKFPVYQASQIWHESPPSPDEKEEEDEGEKKQGFGLVRDLLSAISFALMAPRQYLIEVESCGVPDLNSDPVDSGPTRNLRSIVEVYPSDEFCIHYDYNAGLPPVKTGMEGTFFDPQKGSGEDGIKSVEKAKEEEGEEEEEEKVFSFNLGWQDEEEPAEEEEEEEEEAIEIEMPDEEGEGRISIDDVEREPGAPFLLHATLRELGTDAPPPKKQAGEPHSESLVWHKYGEKEDQEEKTSFMKLGQQLLAHLEDEGVAEAGLDKGTIATAELNMDAATGGKLSEAQGWMDDNLFSITDFGVDLTRNGKTGPFYYEIKKTITASLQLIRGVVAVFNGIGGGWRPQYGWGFKMNVTFLEGGLNFYWGWKEFEDARVFKWYSLQTDLTLVSFSFQIDVGFSASAILIKFEALLYGKLTLEANIEAGFERKNPDTVLPGWLDTWIGTLGKAEFGANIILIHENVFHINAAIKTGFNFQFRISPGLLERLGLEYKLYWMGLIVSATFKVVAFKAKKKEIKLVEGNPKELPWRRGAFPRKAATAWWNLKENINLAWSKAAFQHSRFLKRLTDYQVLQFEMVTACRKFPDKYPYTLYNPQTGEKYVPGYRFTGDDDDRDGQNEWNVSKEKWDRQWEECEEAFDWEGRSVSKRYTHLPVNLSKRLNELVRTIEDKLERRISPKLRDFDRLKEQIMSLNEEIAEAEQEADEGEGASESLKNRAKKLSRHDDLTFRQHIGNRPLDILDGLINDLRYYSLKRQEW